MLVEKNWNGILKKQAVKTSEAEIKGKMIIRFITERSPNARTQNTRIDGKSRGSIAS